MEKNKVLALIPARGGSKGVPRKNIRLLAGKPLIAHSIETAFLVKNINRVIVSTDDEEIAQIAKKFKAEVPFYRPKEFSEDLSLDIDVFKHTLTWLGEHEQSVPEIIVHLRPTCPIRNVDLVEKAIEEFKSHPEADSMRSVTSPKETPYKMWRFEEGFLKPLLSFSNYPEPFNLPRQVLPRIYWQNGYLDLTRAATILNGSMNGKTILPFFVSERSVDIDYEESFSHAEKLLCSIQKGEKTPFSVSYRDPS
ncbi:MAG: acylneuraminate cytidylyltransferase family protein [Deltaproteobacteria bacterium]|nr:acylneuraminate cytidylyltransferase family protein [Deltaproteobacteria bacterium]